MKSILLISLIITILIVLLLFVVFLYLPGFECLLSKTNTNSGNFGNYFAGTIGICFALIGVAFMYLTFYQQRKQQFESAFQQYLSNYFSLLELIKERWLHSTSELLTGDPLYQTGREIFGNAIGYIQLGNEEATFKEIFDIHINVFQHYCNYILEFFTFLDNNSELNYKRKAMYIDRFFSMLSIYELTFFAYYVEFLYNDVKREKLKIQLNKELTRINLSDKISHYDRINNIKICYSSTHNIANNLKKKTPTR